MALSINDTDPVTVTLDERNDRVTITGELDWEVVADPIGPLLSSTSYTIVMQMSGSPFAADFTMPEVDTAVTLSGTATITVENPKSGFGTQTVSGLAGQYGISSTSPEEGLSNNVLLFQQMTRTFPAGELDGDMTYQFLLGFDADFSTVTQVLAALQVRTPLSGGQYYNSDYYTTEQYRGLEIVDIYDGSPDPDSQPQTPDGDTLQDFTGDGTDDILWRKDTGHVGYWEMTDGNKTYHAIGWAGTDWSVAGTGDLNGDGTDDILWRKSAGHVGYFEMDNGSHTYQAIGWAGTDWTVVGIGDLNGDGTDDILWRKSAGHVGYFEMDNGSHTYHAIGWAGTDWSVEGVGDLNGDGTDDILWRKDTGHVGYFEMHDGQDTYHAIDWSGTDWSVEDVADVNGDGTDDVIWRKDTGRVSYWEMNDGNATYHTIDDVGLDWDIV
ncbi:MSHA pilin protein MshA [Rhodovulum sp. P5]|uniref:FG-GAP repeat domain-containing protein n=1 Tax=Rhodovulum sp. P5 TaxID=1564506 RepID=UPI0009C1B390|nr:VCBS repeat-containing protein [Rhodovulum sp. P5]ARE39957.1 MSHA pilin protein MshA [Rhodovulum sp. P5]